MLHPDTHKDTAGRGVPAPKATVHGSHGSPTKPQQPASTRSVLQNRLTPPHPATHTTTHTAAAELCRRPTSHHKSPSLPPFHPYPRCICIPSMKAAVVMPQAAAVAPATAAAVTPPPRTHTCCRAQGRCQSGSSCSLCLKSCLKTKEQQGPTATAWLQCPTLLLLLLLPPLGWSLFAAPGALVGCPHESPVDVNELTQQLRVVQLLLGL